MASQILFLLWYHWKKRCNETTKIVTKKINVTSIVLEEECRFGLDATSAKKIHFSSIIVDLIRFTPQKKRIPGF
jgi:hypothetical protein